MTHPEWAARLVRVVAGQIRHHRRARGMSTRALGDVCAELGHPIPRSVLANLEGGRRETVTVPELFVLAAALEVPPADLLLPLDRVDPVEVLPGVPVPPPVALPWISGRYPLPGVRWQSSAARRYWEHGELVDRWREARDHGEQRRAAGDDESAGQLANLATAMQGALWFCRHKMRDEGLPPPELPPELARAEPKP